MKLEHWKTISSHYIYQSSFGNLRKDTCELPNGQIIHDYYVNEYSDWVNAVVITKKKEVVLVKQYRHGTRSSFLEVPAGKPENNETLAEAIAREVKEETGFVSHLAPILLGAFYVNPATQNNRVYSFLITEAELVAELELDDTELIDVHTFDLETMSRLIKTNEMNHLFTVNAFNLSKEFLMA